MSNAIIDNTPSLNDSINRKGIFQIGYGTVNQTASNVTLAQSIANFDLLSFGIVQTDGSGHSRYMRPPLLITPEEFRKSNSTYLNIMYENANCYYVSDTVVNGVGTFNGAILKVDGIRL